VRNCAPGSVPRTQRSLSPSNGSKEVGLCSALTVKPTRSGPFDKLMERRHPELLTPGAPREEGGENAPCCESSAIEEGTMTVPGTQSVMERYFSTMGADEDFSRFFAENVTWLMVDSGEEVQGAGPVRDYVLQLHSRMESGDQRPLVVTDAQAFLEGDRVNVSDDNSTGLSYCLVYDVSGDLITAMRCYGTIARLMAR
jgi:hypothetical protein